MCEKQKDEATLTWLVRVCAKHPSAAMALACLGMTCTMYCDNRSTITELTAAYKDAVAVNERTVHQLAKLDEHMRQQTNEIHEHMTRQDEKLRQLDAWHKIAEQGK